MYVYIHGNCQARAIALMLQEVHPNWRIESYEVFSDVIISENLMYRSHVREADLVFSQPVHDGYRERDDLSLNWIRANVKPGARVVTYPSMHFEGQIIGTRSLSISGFEMPYTDVLMLHLIYSGIGTNEIKDIMLSEKTYDDTFINYEATRSLKEIYRREESDKIDVRIGSFVEAHLSLDQMFHVINHPRRFLLCYVANALLRIIGSDKVVKNIGQDYLWFPHIPCLPAIRRKLRRFGSAERLAVGENLSYYRLRTSRPQATNYIEKSCTHFLRYQSQHIHDALSKPTSLTYLSDLARLLPDIPNIGIWSI